MKLLILKNLQNDFMPLGAIPLKDAETMLQKANEEMETYDIVVAIQKWFPADHKSFAANHLWRKPGQTITIDGEEITLAIIHCVAESFGAAFPAELNQEKIFKVLKNTGENSEAIMQEIKEIVKEHGLKGIDILGPEED